MLANPHHLNRQSLPQKGHLECYFYCGIWCCSLESLALHIETDHREDNGFSPFAVREVSPPVQSRLPPPPARAPPPVPAQPKPPQNSPAWSFPGRGDVNSSPDDCVGPVRDRSDDQESDLSFICEEPGCGEQVLLIELNEHSDMHDAERLTLDEPSPISSTSTSLQRNSSSSSCSIPPSSNSFATSTTTTTTMQNFTTAVPATLRHGEGARATKDSPRQRMGRKFLSILGYERGRPAKVSKDGVRLGKSELGPHAFEDKMPDWLLKQLQKGPKITKTKIISRSGGLLTLETVHGETNGVLPIIRRLVEYDPHTYKAYLCHPTVKQIGKDKNEGGFCGYRSIQMQLSYLQGSNAPGSEFFPGPTPGILELQEQIENAWDNGVHWYSRSQIGTLRGTRKWIGTLEAHAIYQNLGIPCYVHQFSDSKRQLAHERLLDWVEDYFINGSLLDDSKVQVTLKPPIYFQRPGHSMIIVGMERMRNGSRNLLVFDPMYQAPKAMEQLLQRGEFNIRRPESELLRAYRRSENRLESYIDFEVLELVGHNLPIFPAWDVLTRFPTCPYVYLFFDASSCSYEVYPQEMFHPLFPWFYYGNLFDVREARLHQLSFGSIINNTIIPSACVPVLWSRRLPNGDGWGETRRLIYDDWLMPSTWEVYNHSFWNTPACREQIMAKTVESSAMLHSEPLCHTTPTLCAFDSWDCIPVFYTEPRGDDDDSFFDDHDRLQALGSYDWLSTPPQNGIPYSPQSSIATNAYVEEILNCTEYQAPLNFPSDAQNLTHSFGASQQYPSPFFTQAVELETLCREAGMNPEMVRAFEKPLGIDFEGLCSGVGIDPAQVQALTTEDWVSKVYGRS